MNQSIKSKPQISMANSFNLGGIKLPSVGKPEKKVDVAEKKTSKKSIGFSFPSLAKKAAPVKEKKTAATEWKNKKSVFNVKSSAATKAPAKSVKKAAATTPKKATPVKKKAEKTVAKPTKATKLGAAADKLKSSSSSFFSNVRKVEQQSAAPEPTTSTKRSQGVYKPKPIQRVPKKEKLEGLATIKPQSTYEARIASYIVFSIFLYFFTQF